MATKKNNYITAELDWAEEQLQSWKAYIDANPFHLLQDRKAYKETKAGGSMPVVVATIEQQGKYIQETMKSYLAMLEVVEKLRQQEEEKVEKRGKGELNAQQKVLMKQANGESD